MSIEIQAKTSLASTDNPLQSDPASVENKSKNKEVSRSASDGRPELVVNNSDKNSQVDEISREKIAEAVGKLQDYADQHKRNIRFSVDDETGRTIVRLYDKDNNVLRQIPSEEVLNLLKSIEQNKGLLFEDQA